MWKKDGFGTRGKGLTMRLSRRQERMSRRGAIIVAATLMLVPARAVADVSAQGVGDATQAVDGATQAVGSIRPMEASLAAGPSSILETGHTEGGPGQE